jgi:hypothetical protein
VRLPQSGELHDLPGHGSAVGMNRLLNAFKVRLASWTDRLNEQPPRRHVGCGQFQVCRSCSTVRETDAGTCACGGKWQ